MTCSTKDVEGAIVALRCCGCVVRYSEEMGLAEAFDPKCLTRVFWALRTGLDAWVVKRLDGLVVQWKEQS